MTPEEINKQAYRVSSIYGALQLDLIKMISHYLRVHDPEESLTTWQLRALGELASYDRYVLEAVAYYSGVLAPELKALLKEIGYSSFEEVTGTKPTNELIKIVEASVTQTMEELDTFVNSALAQRNLGGAHLSYVSTVERVAILHNVGALSLPQAVQKSVLELLDKGIPSAFIDRGGNHWDLERYTRQVVRSTGQRTWNQARLEGLKEIGSTLVYVPPHAKARPQCAKCQGKVLDIRPVAENTSKYPSVYQFGYGTPSGHRGCNCTHIWVPYKEGVNIARKPKEPIKKVNQNYEEDQRYKTLARRVKKTKEQIAVLKANGQDTKQKEELLKVQKAIVQKYCKDKDIRRLPELESIGLVTKNRIKKIKSKA